MRDTAQIDNPPEPLVFDSPHIEGPLAGLEAGLAYASARRARRLLTIPCDAPLLPWDLYERLAEAMGAKARVAMAASEEQQHPDCALWDVSLLGELRAYHARAALS